MSPKAKIVLLGLIGVTDSARKIAREAADCIKIRYGDDT